MDVTEQLDERTQQMEVYAGDAQQPQRMPALVPSAAPPERVFGAQQVAVYRDESKVLKKISALAAAAGTDWYYRFPVRKKGGGQDFIEGPSIKLANDIARIYGNCDVDVRVHDIGPSWVFYARFTDYESGYSMTRTYQQRKSQSSMNTNNERALDIAFQIGQSKAIRNVITNALQTFADYGFEQAKDSLVEKIGKKLPEWRDRVLQGLEKEGIDKVRVERVLGRAAADWTAPDVAKVIAMMKAIADGMATWDETFPTEQQAAAAAEAEKAKPETLDGFAEDKPAAAKADEKAEKAAAADKKEAAAAKGKPVADDSLDEPNTQQPAEAKQPVTPKNADDYYAMLKAHVDEATDYAALKAWFLSDEQKKLRGKCSVIGEDLERCKNYTLAKIGDLQKQPKSK